MEKLIQRELVIKSQPILGPMPATAHATTTGPLTLKLPSKHKTKSIRNNSNFSAYRQKPFLGRCQWCHIHSRSAWFFKVNTPPYVHHHPLLSLPTHRLTLLKPLLQWSLLNGFSSYHARSCQFIPLSTI